MYQQYHKLCEYYIKVRCVIFIYLFFARRCVIYLLFVIVQEPSQPKV